MGRRITCIIIVLALALTLSSCSSSPGQDVEGGNSNTNNSSSNSTGSSRPVYQPPIVEELARPLEGELTMLAWSEEIPEWGIYAKLFNELHPGVKISFEGYEPISDNTQQQAMMTRLIADPPDILAFNAETLSFEKFAMDALFVNLYDFMNGLRGINQEDYYSNIFRAAEWRGGLYHLPLYAELRLGVLNKRLMDAIGVDVSQITTVTISDLIDYYLRAADVLPDEELYPYRYFSTMQVLRMSRLYDIETGEVYVDTPEMRELFERAITIPLNSDYVEFTSTGYFDAPYYDSFERIWREVFRGSNHLLKDMADGAMWYMFIVWLYEHPDMQFSNLTTFVTGDSENIGFSPSRSLSIMRNSPDTELAWEFVRFIMEYEGNLRSGYSGQRIGLPINRARFENQPRDYIDDYVYSGFRFLMGQHDTTTEEERERDVEIAMDFLRGYMGQLNYEIRYSAATLNSLIYPELWLLYSGQQDVARTLANIHNRLVLYVNE